MLCAKRGKVRESIDDPEYDESVENYCAFDNVFRDYNDAINDSLSGFDFSQEATNYYPDNETEEEVIDTFKDSEKKVDKFKKTLVNPHRDDNSDSVFCAILYAIRLQLTEKTNACDNENELKNEMNKVDLSELFFIKDSLKLNFDILNFEQQRHPVNQILNKRNFFLKVYKLKERFQSLVKQNPDKKNIARELSECITNKYNGFNIFWLEQSKKIMRKFISIEIIYKPAKNCNDVISCYFSNKINLAFRSTFSENGILRHGAAFQCHFCSNYYGRKDKYDRHLDRYIYNFNTQSLITFEENLKYKSDISLTAYIDFETTALTDDCLDPENAKMFAVSYVVIFTFHPELEIDKVITKRCFGH